MSKVKRAIILAIKLSEGELDGTFATDNFQIAIMKTLGAKNQLPLDGCLKLLTNHKAEVAPLDLFGKKWKCMWWG
jgi:hypothetical protein